MKKRGFTLIEMLIVIVIIGILAGALIPRIGSARDKANDTAREANVRSLATAMVSYGMDHGYPKSDDAGFTTGEIEAGGETGIIVNDMKGFVGLSNYSIPNDNLDGQPTTSDHYYYKALDTEQHFVIFTTLSCASEAEGNCGNCDAKGAANATSITAVNAMTGGNAFCYFQ